MGTVFADIDLSSVKGLETIHHDGPSTIGLDTIGNSKGQISSIFLRGCGVPENLITYLDSLTGRSFGFYTCIISFTDKNDEFSKRLYNDMQSEGVRCWQWKANAERGSSLKREVDRTVCRFDKFVAILSRHSLNAEPVIQEIEQALQPQRRRNQVLYPIRLDDTDSQRSQQWLRWYEGLGKSKGVSVSNLPGDVQTRLKAVVREIRKLDEVANHG